MVVVRFEVQCQPERTDEVLAARGRWWCPAARSGVVHFDIARDL